MVKLPTLINFFKLRGSVAQTGSDPAPFQTIEYFTINPGGSIAKSNTNPVDTLKPEKTTSQEYGFDINLLENRFGLEFTYYKTNSKNQLVRVQTPPASGYQGKFINAGNIQNTGHRDYAEHHSNKIPKLLWVANINYAKNNNKVLSIVS